MTNSITRDNVFFAFGSVAQETARINQNLMIKMETHDCFEGQIQTTKDLLDTLDWDHVNPATGPIYIEGVKPGDILKINIQKIHLRDQSSMVTLPGEGALGDVITDMETSILRVEEKEIIFKDKIRVKRRPMIGVIGVAPADASIPNGTPGKHGGNMDCTLITEGSSIYFEAQVEGGMFGAGDMHSVMGDGEIVICGAETEGSIEFSSQVVDLRGLPTPFIQTAELVAVVASAQTVDEAASQATHLMAEFLTKFVNLPINDAGMLMSIVGELKFCQIVDPLKTVRFEFPKYVLEQYGFKLP